MHRTYRRWSLVVVMAVAGVLITAATASPARKLDVRGSAALVDCINRSTPQLQPFSALGRVAGIADRGGTLREPDLAQTHDDLPASAKGKAGKNFTASVPRRLRASLR